MCSELFPIKVAVRTLLTAENFSHRPTPTVARNSLRNDKSNAVESNYVFKNPQMKDLHFIAVNSLSATDTKDGSACESLQSLEICITALDWIMRNMVTERNLTDCEGNSPEGCHAVQFCRHVYLTVLRYSVSNKNKLIRMLQDGHLHRQ